MRTIEAPNVWGPGQLIAFSALDGPTDFKLSLVARTTPAAGLEIVRPGRCVIQFDRIPPQKAMIGGDFFSLETTAGTIRGAMLDTHQLLLEGRCQVAEDCPPEIQTARVGHRTLIASAGFLDDRLLKTDIEDAISRRRAWLNSLRLPGRLPPERRRTLAKALSILKGQICSPEGRIRRRWSMPDRWPHRGMWLWDSAFHAIGWRHVDAPLAAEMLEAVFDTQQPDGMIPLYAGPTAPANPVRLTQPPVLAMAASLVEMQLNDPAWLEGLYEPLCRYIRWDMANRDIDGTGLLEWFPVDADNCHGGESGLDNSPRFDAGIPLDAVDFNAYIATEAEQLSALAHRMGRMDESRHWSVQWRRLCGLMNARLWNEELGLYVDCDARTGRQSDLPAATAFLPLLCGACDETQARRLAGHLEIGGLFDAPLPVSTVAPSHRAYSKDMWRGPTWVNLNWLIARGFDRYGLRDPAERIRQTTMQEVERWYHSCGSIFEFYDDQAAVSPRDLPRKGAGTDPLNQVIHEFGWSAALYADMVLADRS